MRVLVLGGSGMLGHKLWQILSRRFTGARHDTWVTLRRSKADYAQFTGLFDSPNVIEGLDALNFPSVEATLNGLRPDVILNCIGVTKRREDKDNPVPVIALNALFPHQLGKWAAKNGSRLIHFSTDCVFSGAKANLTEEDAPSETDLYGRTKALGEVAARNCLTLRTSFIGRELGKGTELLEWLLAQEGRSIKGFDQVIYSGVSTVTLARIVGDVIEKHPDLSGLYQVSSKPISKYELLKLAAKTFGIQVNIAADSGLVCTKNLDGTRFRQATGIVAPEWPVMMCELAEDPTPYRAWKQPARQNFPAAMN